MLVGTLLLCTASAFGRDNCDATRWEVNPISFDTPASIHQVLVITTDSWSSDVGTLNKFERRGETWCEVGAAFPVVLTRRGSAWGLGLHRPLAVKPQKVEGDERVPAGIFRLGPAFGYDDEFEPALRFPYMQATRRDYFVTDENSADYNTWVRLSENANDPRTHWRSFEVMRRSDALYKLGIVIQQNTAPVVRGRGSATFLHIWRSPTIPTIGIGMRETNMRRLVDWLNPSANPILIEAPRSEVAKLKFKSMQ
jgi:D-alanyl-D-alanine dipeptidase